MKVTNSGTATSSKVALILMEHNSPFPKKQQVRIEQNFSKLFLYIKGYIYPMRFISKQIKL